MRHTDVLSTGAQFTASTAEWGGAVALDGGAKVERSSAARPTFVARVRTVTSFLVMAG